MHDEAATTDLLAEELEPQREPSQERRVRVVAIVAAVLFAPQVIAHLVIPFTVLPTFRQMFADMGGKLPPMTAFMLALGPALGLILLAVDVFVFWLFYRLARKYWIGLLFAPLFTGALVLGPLTLALYAPMYQVITLVQ